MNITETECVKEASKVAVEAYKSYLQDALDMTIDNDHYEEITGHSIETDALKAIQDNSDTLLDIAEDNGLEEMANSVEHDTGVQDFLFDTLLEDYNSAKEDFEMQNQKFAKTKISNRITSTLEDDGITNSLFAKATGSSIEEVAEEIAKQMVEEGNDSVDSKEEYIDVALVDDYITNYESRIQETAASRVYDDLLDQSQGRDSVDMSKIQNYDYDNCRYASGIISLDDYIERNMPELVRNR